MARAHVVSWIAAGVFALGGGVALAQTAPVGDEAPAEVTTTTPVDETTTTTTADEPTTTTVPNDTTTTEARNHGEVVSEAAHDHSHDAECGNHGKWVSAVARGEASCVSDGDDSHDDGVEAHGHGKGQDKDKHDKADHDDESESEDD